MLDFSGMIILLGGMTFAITAVIAMVELTESNKKLNRRLSRMEQKIDKYILED